MAGPNFQGTISGFTVGDDLGINRTVDGIPASTTVVKAWFTVKASITDADDAALIQKIITPTMDTGQGIITDVGTSGTAILDFYLLSDDTVNLGNPSRATGGFSYDIQIKLTNGKIYTSEIGTITAHSQVTLATS